MALKTKALISKEKDTNISSYKELDESLKKWMSRGTSPPPNPKYEKNGTGSKPENNENNDENDDNSEISVDVEPEIKPKKFDGVTKNKEIQTEKEELVNLRLGLNPNSTPINNKYSSAIPRPSSLYTNKFNTTMGRFQQEALGKAEVNDGSPKSNGTTTQKEFRKSALNVEHESQEALKQFARKQEEMRINLMTRPPTDPNNNNNNNNNNILARSKSKLASNNNNKLSSFKSSSRSSRSSSCSSTASSTSSGSRSRSVSLQKGVKTPPRSSTASCSSTAESSRCSSVDRDGASAPTTELNALDDKLPCIDLNEKSVVEPSAGYIYRVLTNSNVDQAPPVFTNRIRKFDSVDKPWWLQSNKSVPNLVKSSTNRKSMGQVIVDDKSLKNDENDVENEEETSSSDDDEDQEMEGNFTIMSPIIRKINNNSSDKKSELFIGTETNIDDILGSPLLILPSPQNLQNSAESPPAEQFFANLKSIGSSDLNGGGQLVMSNKNEEAIINETQIISFEQEEPNTKVTTPHNVGGESWNSGAEESAAAGLIPQTQREKLDDATLQLYRDGEYGPYLDLDSSIAEQQEELEGFLKNRKNSIVLRTQLPVRVHTIIEKLCTTEGSELRRALFSLKQIFQEDKELVHEFVESGGLSCLINVGSTADQNYQNYILRAIGQVMLYVDGMYGVMNHEETIRWLYSLIHSTFRLVQKTALKLLLVFVDYIETNCLLLARAIAATDHAKGVRVWSSVMALLRDADSSGGDTEILVYAMTLLNKVLNGIPDLETYYDHVDAIEEQGIANIIQRYMGKQCADLDLLQQFQIYEVVLKHEDGEEDNWTTIMMQLDEGMREKLLRRKWGNSHHQDQNHHVNHDHNGGDWAGATTKDRRKSRRHSAGSGGDSKTEFNNNNNKKNKSSSRVFNHDDDGVGFPGVQSDDAPYLGPSSKLHSELNFSSQNQNGHTKPGTLSTSPSSSSTSSSHSSSPDPTGHHPGHHRRHIVTNGCPASSLHPQNPTTPLILSQEQQKCSVGDVGVTPGLRRRRERAAAADLEKQISFPHLPPLSSTREGMKTRGVEDSPEPVFSPIIKSGGVVNGHAPWAATPTPPIESDLEEHGEDSVGGCEVKRENTVKDLTQKLAHQMGVGVVVGGGVLDGEQQSSKSQMMTEELSGLVSKAKEGLAKSKSRADIKLTQQNVTTATQEVKVIVEPKKSDNEVHWDFLVKNVKSLKRPLEICDLDFTDLREQDDEDIMEPSHPLGMAFCNGPPPMPPMNGMAPPPPPPSTNQKLSGPPIAPPLFGVSLKGPLKPQSELLLNGHSGSLTNGIGPENGKIKSDNLNQNGGGKTKKTVKLFWKEVREDPVTAMKVQKAGSIWDEICQVSVDTARLEHLFESRAKDMINKKGNELNKNKEIVVLDPKRSNAINIGMTKLPPPRTIKTAILKMDSTIINREGIEKLLSMLPSEEERAKITEAQFSQPEIPLGSAEQFLLTLSSISELNARLKLWAFKMDYENLEKEVAEPLMDLKLGIEALEKNKTFRYILTTLLSIGNFLNGSESRGFQIDYLAKVPEVKDTVHKHSLLHHLCHMVIEKFPDESSDLYSEIGPVTRASRVDFDEVSANLAKMETECKLSWDHLRVIAKHDGPTNLKLKMSEFLADSAERIIILQIIHRRIMNKFHKFLIWLGISAHQISTTKPQYIYKIISEFALEYRTTRERVIQTLQKKANHRERNKTRGKMITEQIQYKSTEDRADAELRQVLNKPRLNHHHITNGGSHESSPDSAGMTTWRRGPPKGPKFDQLSHSANGNGHADDEILESLVKSATHATRTQPRDRKRNPNRFNSERKSLRRTLRNGLSEEEKKLLSTFLTNNNSNAGHAF